MATDSRWKGDRCPTLRRRVPALLLLLVIVGVHGFAWLRHKEQPLPPFAVAAASESLLEAAPPPAFQTRFISSSIDDYVHSSAVAPLADGGLIAVWFAGSREGAADVEIRSSRFDPIRQDWGPEEVLVSRTAAEASLNRYIRKLGNPVIAMAPNNRLWLFYVSVSIGGWSTSAINTMYSDDSGLTWSTPKRLITSPFFNLSTLVRNNPVFHQDGSIGLPVYHEFLGKFAEYLHLGPEGEVLHKYRINNGRHSLQPSIVPLSDDSALALLRNGGISHRKVLASFTSDRGQTWSEPVPVEPWNPNSSVAAIGLQNKTGDILVALNNVRKGRHRLSLYRTDARLQTWELVKVLDQSPDPEGKLLTPEEFRNSIREKFFNVGDTSDFSRFKALLSHIDQRRCTDYGCEIKYEYPFFSRTADGNFHLVYSWNNSLIKHVTFNQTWLKEQL